MDRANGRYDRYCAGSLFVPPWVNTPCNHLVKAGRRYLIWPERRTCCFCCDAAHGCGMLARDWLAGAEFLGEVPCPNTVGGRSPPAAGTAARRVGPDPAAVPAAVAAAAGGSLVEARASGGSEALGGAVSLSTDWPPETETGRVGGDSGGGASSVRAGSGDRTASGSGNLPGDAAAADGGVFLEAGPHLTAPATCYKWNKPGLQDNLYYETVDGRVPVDINQVPNDNTLFDANAFSTAAIPPEVFDIPDYCSPAGRGGAISSCPSLSVCGALRAGFA